jgi:hypothetical protein
MNKHDQQWERLMQAAAQAPPRRLPVAAPFGFATRVVARWRERPSPSIFGIWKMLSARVLAFGCVVMIASLAATYGVISEELLRPAPDLTVQLFESASEDIEEILLP